MAGESCYYKLSLSNVTSENENTSNISTASNMNLLLEQELDLHSHIYMRSLSAECCLDDITLSNLPATFSGNGFIDLCLTFPNVFTHGNAVINDDVNKKRSVTNCRIRTSDIVTSEPKVAVDHVNSLVRSYSNKFIILRYAELLCDNNLFLSDNLTSAQNAKFSDSDLSLLRWYIEVAVLSRLQLVAVINTLLKMTDMPVKTEKTGLPDVTAKSESDTVSSSKLFQPLAGRTTVTHRLVSFDDFYSTATSKPVDDPTPILANLVKKVGEYLLQMGFVTMVDGELTDESVNTLKIIRSNNVALLKLADVLEKILKWEETKQNSPAGKGLSELYRDEIMQLSLDVSGKCVFDTRPDLFMLANGSNYTVSFDSHTSRVLGAYCSEEEHLFVGPLQHTSSTKNTDLNRPVLKKNNILSKNERLYSRIKTLPRKIFFLTDLIANDCHYESSWKSHSAFSSYQILAAFFVDETDIKTGSVAKISHPRRFCRVKQAQNVLRNLNLVLVDEFFQPLIFSPKTYCFFSLCLRPAENNL